MNEYDPYLRQEKKRQMLSLMEAGDWRSILKEFDDDQEYREPLLVWVRPSIEMLKFIQEELSEKQITKVIIRCFVFHLKTYPKDIIRLRLNKF